MYSVYGFENPLMDIIAHVNNDFLKKFGKSPGTMHLVPSEEVESLLKEIPSFRTLPGGSAANTARAIAWLRRNAAHLPGRAGEPSPTAVEPPVFNGAVGHDQRAREYEKALSALGVVTRLCGKDSPTGTSLILVTPDGERTMNTFLGACRDFQASDLDLTGLEASRMLYLTSYLWDTENQRQAVRAALDFSHSGGRRIPIAFDLADPFAVRRYGEELRSWIPGRVDVLFGNREELSLLTGSSCDEDCVRAAAALAPMVVMKVGARGCLLECDGVCTPVEGIPAAVVDTTGAGDSFAGGFLYGMLRGLSPVECARLANWVASRIVGVEGCDYESLSGDPGFAG